ncbi:MAG: GGDEF domain-containing protein [Thermomonas sp.]|nr:GGDEF domain-containing protein [Thermomonas sp.]
MALLFLDLDRFKDINDSLGHATGDRILRMAAQRLQRAVGPSHTVARIGGDEFTVVLEDLAHAGEADTCAVRVIDAFDEPLLIDERHEIAITPSIGISLYPDPTRRCRPTCSSMPTPRCTRPRRRAATRSCATPSRWTAPAASAPG